MDFKVVFGFDLLEVLLGIKFRMNWYQNFGIWLRNEGFGIERIKSRLITFEQMTLSSLPRAILCLLDERVRVLYNKNSILV